MPYAHAEVLAASIPGARLVTIEGGDHMMPFTHADEVAAEVTAFVLEVSDR